MCGTTQCRVPHRGWGLDTSPRFDTSCVPRVFRSTGCPSGCVLEILATQRLQLSSPSISHAWRSYPRRSAVCHRGGMRYSTPSLAETGTDTRSRMGRAFHAHTSRDQSHPVLAPPRAYASVRMRRFRSCCSP